jgi:hypothetical protein
MSVRRLIGLLDRVGVETAARDALALQAEVIAADARVATGADLEVVADSEDKIIGSRSNELLRREVGSTDGAPRPVLAGTAATHAASVAASVGEAIADALRRT